MADLNSSRPRYNVRTAAQSQSNIAAVLAGFAFTAVVLVVQTQLPSAVSLGLLEGQPQLLRGRVAIAFLIAFFGCIISAFMFSVVAGEQEVEPRSHIVAFLGGGGFSISTVFIFWGVVVLSRLFLPPDAVHITYVALFAISLLSALLLSYSYIDYLVSAHQMLLQKDSYRSVVICMVIVTLGAATRWVLGPQAIYSAAIFFNIAVYSSLAFVVLGATAALYVSEGDSIPLFSRIMRDLWLGVLGIIISLLFLLLP